MRSYYKSASCQSCDMCCCAALLLLLLLLLHCPKYRTDDDFEAAREAVDDMKSSYEALRDKCTEEELPELDKIVSERTLWIVQ